jgi:hypothetical protein
MSKKLCRDWEVLDEKSKDKKIKYLCGKCEKESPKEKWCCKPKKIKR